MSSYEAPLQRPSPFNTLKELTAPIEWLHTFGKLPSLLSLPKGDTRPIMLVPGFMADELSMSPLKHYLSKMNYNANHWRLGRNAGNVDEDIVRLGQQTLMLFEQCNRQAVTLIGWSLGGVIAREVARLFPDVVREVITLGTPISGGPKYTAVGKQYAAKRSIDLDAFEAHVLSRNKIGFSQPVTSIYSKSDGVVGWRASLDTYNAQARNIEVKSTHLGLGVHPKVWQIIIETLADSVQRDH